MGIIRFVRSVYYLFSYLKYSIVGKFKNNSVDISTRIRGKVFISQSKIGKYNYLGPNSIVNDTVIHNYCSIAPQVQIGGMEHNYRKLSTSTQVFNHRDSSRVTIKDDVWVGAAALIKRGVTIGRGAVVGAGSVVLSDVEPYTIVVGSPAKKLKYRFEPHIIDRLEKSRWWEHSPKKARSILDGITEKS